MQFEFVVAVDENLGIGKEGKIPWHCPDDLKNFKTVTNGHILVMGYKSYKDIHDNYFVKRKDIASLPPHEQFNTPLLPGRKVVVLTTKHTFLPGAYGCCQSIQHIKDMLMDSHTLMVVGGSQVFDAFLQTEEVSRIHLSIIKGTYDCDVNFPASISRDANNTWTVTTKTKNIPYHFGGYGIIHDQFSFTTLQLIDNDNGAVQ